MRRAAKVDRNHGEIVKALRAVGAGVCDLSAVGQGCPDLLVSWGRCWYLLEVKDGAKSPSRRKLTPDQQAWHAAHRAQVHIVETVEDALLAVTGWGDPNGVEAWKARNL